MLCERCQTQEATVQVTLLMGESATNHNFCEACYPSVESKADARTAGWTSKEEPPQPLPSRKEIERMTAEEYLEAAARSAGTAADKPVFRHILAELEHLPRTQERLSFELLELLSNALKHRMDSFMVARCCMTWAGSVTKERADEYIRRLEEISHRCFDLFAPHPSDRRDRFLDQMALQGVLMAIHRVDQKRFRRALNQLKRRCRKPADARLKMLGQIEDWITRMDQGGTTEH